MDPLLKLLHDDASLTPAQLAGLLATTEDDIRSRLRQHENSGVLLGYRAVLNEEKLGRDIVRALIEVKITPERGGGFDKLAERIAPLRRGPLLPSDVRRIRPAGRGGRRQPA
jgi:DNA-binding Lrp family transcriptional regulator